MERVSRFEFCAFQRPVRFHHTNVLNQLSKEIPVTVAVSHGLLHSVFCSAFAIAQSEYGRLNFRQNEGKRLNFGPTPQTVPTHPVQQFSAVSAAKNPVKM
ncbi:hypothetical protein Zmor_027141 [Zophobas morio]|uniref:Uncharacterized protein n=1 Tax=Zophobas morio TaxID=2755281 RepID=A0AA38HN51_9CUCU|nr:hypothetical protein Zmor_027141 [Zophobas morio]